MFRPLRDNGHAGKGLPGHVRLTLLLLTLAFCIPVFPQQTASSDVVSEDLIDNQIALVSEQSDLAPEVRNELLSDLELARTYLQTATRDQAAAAEFENLAATEKQRVAQFDEQIQQLGSEPSAVATDASSEEIESQIALVTTERRGLAERRSEILRAIEEAPRRNEVIQERLGELRTNIDEARANLSTAGDSPNQAVTQLLSRAAIRAGEAEIKRLKAELISAPARRQIRAAERNWVNKAIEDADRRLRLLAEAAEAALEAATAEELAETDAIAAKLQEIDPRLEKFTETNRQLAKQLADTAALTDQARRDSARLIRQIEDIEEDSYLMNRRLEVIGHGAMIGEVMVSQLENLPDTGELKQSIKDRNQKLTEASHTLITVEEKLREMEQRQLFAKSLVPDYELLEEKAKTLLDQLLNQRSVLLQDNEQSLSALVRLLVDNNVAANRIIEKTQSFNDFLMGNLLWVQNFGFLRPSTLKAQLALSLNGQSWATLPAYTVNGFLRSPFLTLLLALFLPLLFLSHRLRKANVALLTTPTTLSGESLKNIFLSLAYSFGSVLPWPLLLYLLGEALAASEAGSAFVDALAPTLQQTARVLFVLLFVRRLINPRGVGRRYLKWNARMLDAVRAELNWAGPVIVAAAFVEEFALNLEISASGGPLGAIATLVQGTTVIVVCMRLMRQDIFREDRATAIVLRVTAGLTLLCMLPLLMGLLFASEIYQNALGRSLVAILLIKLAADIMTRWLLIMRSRLERKNRDELRTQDSDKNESETETAEAVDVASLSEAHSKLIGLARTIATVVALWLIWAPSLPMLTLLEDVTLWQTSDSSSAIGGLRSVTLFDLIVAVFILIITTLVARHLPSLVRLFLLEWAQISPGARYATSILLQYLVVAIGGSMFLTTIGWEWSRVQWLVAALGVGIGFGLQEIVANFISGIIILFERPIRVGDIITAGGAEGVVTEIRPRSTVIQTFERKEHLIPNKELITGPVVNWSLTDDAIRLVVPVGVAYGCDVNEAMKLLIQAAREEPLVLAQPEPMATLEDFGDNALLLWLRCYAAEERLRIASDLRVAIYTKFAQAGIEISFPQRDIHLDFKDSLRVKMDPVGNGEQSGNTPQRDAEDQFGDGTHNKGVTDGTDGR